MPEPHPGARDSRARDPRARDPRARDPRARDPRARDPRARETGARHPGARPGARDPSLPVERTRLAWRRTAIAFAAVGGIILRTSVIAGVVVLAVTPLIWVLGHLASPHPDSARAAPRLRLISVAIVAVAVVALGVSLIARGR